MLNGQLYSSSDQELQNLMKEARVLLDEFNNTNFGDYEIREEIAKKLFGKTGKNLTMNKPFYCDYGKNIFIGDNFYANFDCILLDCNKIVIGDNVFLGPKVSVLTATHPLDASVRLSYLEYAKKVSIGDNTWIGGNTVINPGVNIGKNVVIGSGSVVTKDIVDNALAYGNPCKVIRIIDESDKSYWEEKQKEYFNK